jgi:hypothetical protein
MRCNARRLPPSGLSPANAGLFLGAGSSVSLTTGAFEIGATRIPRPGALLSYYANATEGGQAAPPARVDHQEARALSRHGRGYDDKAVEKAAVEPFLLADDQRRQFVVREED